MCGSGCVAFHVVPVRTAAPESPTSTQVVLDGQAMSLLSSRPEDVSADQVVPLNVVTVPVAVPAAQYVVVGHHTEYRWPLETIGADHEVPS